MGFYIQNDFWKTAQDMSASEQDAFFGALVRRYFTGTDESKRLKKLVRVAYNAVSERIDRARAEAARKQTERGQKPDKPTDKPTDKTTDKTRTKPRTKTGTPLIERESEREIRVSGSNSPSQTPPSLMRGGESGDGVYDRDIPPTAVGQADGGPVSFEENEAMCQRMLEVLRR